MTKQRSALKGRDAALLILIIVAAAVIGTVMWFMRNNQTAERVIVKVDGNTVFSESLDNDAEYKATGYDGGYNTVVIKDKRVYVTEADCPDKVCMNSGAIENPGDTIVCMPHRMVVEIEGSGEQVDSVVN